MKNKFLQEKMNIIPKQPGCYLWKDKFNNVIYVGKAKNLYNRTHQYFEHDDRYKINYLTEEIEDIDYFVVNNANEALILENNLIKKYWPKYNTMLKDSSEYPYIVLTDSKVPEIIYTRKFNKYKGKHYGPLADSKFNRYELFKFLNEIFPIKQDSILKGQYGLFAQIYCQKFHLQNIDSIDNLYNEWRKFVDDLFHGKTHDIIKVIENLEEKAVQLWDFNHAEKYHNLIESIQNLTTSQIVQLTKKSHKDYFCYYQQDDVICFNIFNYLDGKLISKHNSIHKIYDNLEDVVNSFVHQYYSSNLLPKEVVLSLQKDNLSELSSAFEINFVQPINNTDKEIMATGIENAKVYLKNNKLVLQKKLAITIDAANSLANILNIDSCNHIEIFDNSNINLQHSVSAMAVFKNGVASKKDYRRYNLDELEIKSDFHYMQEVIYRRYNKLLARKQTLPDLIIVDGGKIQVEAAKISLQKLNLWDHVNVIGLKKNDAHKTEAIVTKEFKEINLDKKSTLYSFLLNMQEEVHNFAISFYRSKHLKSNFATFLDGIQYLGPKTKQKIIKTYPTLHDLQQVSLQELEQIVQTKIAKQIKEKLTEYLIGKNKK